MGKGSPATSDSMGSTETQLRRSAAPAREEIAVLRLLGEESVDVVWEKSGRISTSELTYIVSGWGV